MAGSGELVWLSECVIRWVHSCWFPERRLWREEVAKLRVTHRDCPPQQGPELAGLTAGSGAVSTPWQRHRQTEGLL